MEGSLWPSVSQYEIVTYPHAASHNTRLGQPTEGVPRGSGAGPELWLCGLVHFICRNMNTKLGWCETLETLVFVENLVASNQWEDTSRLPRQRVPKDACLDPTW